VALLTRIMQTLFKNLFNSMNLLRISFLVIITKISSKPFVKGKSRYRKINFFTTSALLYCIIWVNGELSFAQIHTGEMLQKDQINITQKKRLEDGMGRDPFSLPSGVYPLSKGENKGYTTVIKEEESKVGRVRAILISRYIRLALVDRRIVKVGDSINGEKVVEISSGHVVLGKGGKKKTLFLYQSAIPLRVEKN